MEEYLNFDNEELIKDLIERLKITENERDFLSRCCMAYQYAYEKQEKQLQHVTTLYNQSLQQQLNMAKTQEKTVELLANNKS